MKFLIGLMVLGLVNGAEANAEKVACVLENQNYAYDIDISNLENGKNHVVVEKMDIHQPTLKTKFIYDVEKVTQTETGIRYLLSNYSIYKQADQKRVLTLDQNGEGTFEVFWIRGPALPGFQIGGYSGSDLFKCVWN